VLAAHLSRAATAGELVTPPAPDAPRTVAAVDLGSNSFHMIIARSDGGPLEVLDRIRERVQIAAGLDAEGVLSTDAQARAFACLERFGQRLRGFPPDRVRAVGTNTFRHARNAQEFRERAESVLGHPIEIISGGEEARLIYLGVVRSQILPASRRLLIDVGGGSTEIIIGDGEEILAAESTSIGCVSHSLRHFPGGRITEKGYRAAVLAARVELRPYAERLREIGWDLALGSAGTAHAIQALVRSTGDPREAVTRDGLRRLRQRLLEAEHIDAIKIPELREDRRTVFPGGLAITQAIFKALGIEQLSATPGGLREGILHDLVGRIEHQDIREATIRRFLGRYGIDPEQGTRVERTARLLLAEVERAWGLADPEHALRLAWAARLHEIGLAISHQGYHKHGEYLLRHSDMAGFSNDEQEVLAALVRAHRRRASRKSLAKLPHVAPEAAIRLCILLRLAVLLNRGRRTLRRLPFQVRADGNTLELVFPEGYAAAHPLTVAELAEETELLARWGTQLRVSERAATEGTSATK